MTFLCEPEIMYSRMLSWESHAVMVQKVQLRSASSAPL